LPALAVSFTVVATLTEETVTVKLALLAPTGTVTEAGTVTADLLLASLTANPPLAAAAFNVTVQLSVPDPVIEFVLQLNSVKTELENPPRESAKLIASDTIEAGLVMISGAVVPIATCADCQLVPEGLPSMAIEACASFRRSSETDLCVASIRVVSRVSGAAEFWLAENLLALGSWPTEELPKSRLLICDWLAAPSA
jgi:hypothetical protein